MRCCTTSHSLLLSSWSHMSDPRPYQSSNSTQFFKPHSNQDNMTRSKPKKDISQTNLNYHNIFYDADLFRPPCILPGHVDAVRETLLSFENIVPGGTGWTETFQDELARYEPRHISPESALPPDASFIPVAGYEKDLNERSPQWHTAHDNMKSCEEVAKTAWKLENDMEDGWTNFWRQSTFTVVSETTKNQPGFQ
jgi:hypothetical protein